MYCFNVVVLFTSCMCVYINVDVSTVHSSFAFLCNNIKLSAFRDRSLANPKLRH